MWAPLGELGGRTSSPETLRDRYKKALEMERLFLWELCKGNLEGDLQRDVKEGSGNGTSFSM
jgi:hypothetical protein